MILDCMISVDLGWLSATVDEAERFLMLEFIRELYGHTLHEGEMCEVRLIVGGVVRQREFFSSLTEAVTYARSAGKDATVAVGVAPRRGRIGKKEGVSRIAAVWVDLDCDGDEQERAEALLSLEKFPLPPSIIVDSGGGFHAYWLLSQPIPGSEKHVVEGANERLIQLFDGDSQAKDASRVMRLPYAYNAKRGRCAILHEYDSSRRYSIEEVLQALTEAEQVRSSAQVKAKARGIADIIAPYSTPNSDQRHNLAFCLSGFLRKAGYPVEFTEQVVEEICALTDDEQTEDRLRAVADTYSDHGAALKGYSGLREILSPTDLLGLEALVGKPREKEREYHLTEVGNAKRLIAEHGRDLRYCTERGKWLVWDGRRWREDEGEVMRRAKAVVTAMGEEAERCGDHKLVDHAKKCETRHQLVNMITLAESEEGVAVSIEDLDKDRWLLNCSNGTLDLRTGELLPHTREHLITRKVPVEYDPNAECPRWDSFLDQIMGGNQELVRFLKRAVGYSLTGIVNEHCMFICHGSGRNGKSTFLEVIRAISGGYGAVTPPETLMAKKWDTIPNDIARLAGVRLVTSSEGERGRRLAESLIKRITGGDRVSGRFLYQEAFEFDPALKVWYASNHKPEIEGTDEGIWSRIRLIPFGVYIPEAKRDKELKEKLLNELPGILRWAVEGCLEWQTMGLGEPPEVVKATASYRNECDIIAKFIDDCCVVAPNAKAFAEQLNVEYEQWCRELGEVPLSQKAFGEALSEKGFERKKSTGGKWARFGIGIAEVDESLD